MPDMSKKLNDSFIMMNILELLRELKLDNREEFDDGMSSHKLSTRPIELTEIISLIYRMKKICKSTATAKKNASSN